MALGEAPSTISSEMVDHTLCADAAALLGGIRFCSNLVDCPIERVGIGMPVDLVFEEAGQGIFLPKFRSR